MWLYIITGSTLLCAAVLVGVCIYALVEVSTLTRRKKLDSYAEDIIRDKNEKDKLRRQVQTLQEYVEYRQGIISDNKENQKNEPQIKEDNK